MMRHFVIVYDRSGGRMLDLDAFDAPNDAFAALVEAERSRGMDSNIEVVLLTAGSEDEIRRTHGRYFRSPVELLSSAGF